MAVRQYIYYFLLRKKDKNELLKVSLKYLKLSDNKWRVIFFSSKLFQTTGLNFI